MSKDEDAAARRDAKQGGQRAKEFEQGERDSQHGHPSGKSGGTSNETKARKSR